MQTPHIFRFVRPLLAILVTVFSFGFLFYLCVYPIPEQNKDIIQVAAGLDLGLLLAIGNYYFGNSKDKSDQEQSARQNTTATTTANTTTVTTPPGITTP